MRKLTITLLAITVVSTICFGQSVKVMTYNIKNDYQKVGSNNWDSRKAEMIDLINYYAPSIFGVQEALQNQVQYIDTKLKDYTYIGVGREDAKTKGEYSSIHYDSTKFRTVNQGTFWLSETPEKVSKGWDAAYERICTYGLFESKNDDQLFWVFNTHFDHIGVEARKNSILLIQKKINELNSAGYPVLAMGDFNLTPDKLPIEIMKKEFEDSYDISQNKPYGPKGTFNGFEMKNSDDRIDYIFVKGINVLSYAHIDDRLKSGLWVSDHLPVLTEIQFK